MTVPAGGGASGPGETAAAGAAAGTVAAAARTAAANTEAEVNAPPNGGAQPNYPYVVTLQNGRTQLHINQAMGEKAIKAVADGQPAADATPEDLACYQYLLWQESLKLEAAKAELAARRSQASISSVRQAGQIGRAHV